MEKKEENYYLNWKNQNHMGHKPLALFDSIDSTNIADLSQVTQTAQFILYSIIQRYLLRAIRYATEMIP